MQQFYLNEIQQNLDKILHDIGERKRFSYVWKQRTMKLIYETKDLLDQYGERTKLRQRLDTSKPDKKMKAKRKLKFYDEDEEMHESDTD